MKKVRQLSSSLYSAKLGDLHHTDIESFLVLFVSGVLRGDINSTLDMLHSSSHKWRILKMKFVGEISFGLRCINIESIISGFDAFLTWNYLRVDDVWLLGKEYIIFNIINVLYYQRLYGLHVCNISSFPSPFS